MHTDLDNLQRTWPRLARALRWLDEWMEYMTIENLREKARLYGIVPNMTREDWVSTIAKQSIRREAIIASAERAESDSMAIEQEVGDAVPFHIRELVFASCRAAQGVLWSNESAESVHRRTEVIVNLVELNIEIIEHELFGTDEFKGWYPASYYNRIVHQISDRFRQAVRRKQLRAKTMNVGDRKTQQVYRWADCVRKWPEDLAGHTPPHLARLHIRRDNA